MESVTKIINFIAARPLAKREFSILLSEFETTFGGLLMFNNVRWLGRSKVLERFVECLDEIKHFISVKKNVNVEQLDNHIWITNLMIFTDISLHMNNLNYNSKDPEKQLI
jgi:hypothetical protein